MIESEVTPRVYVASLSDYNDGRLVGRWIDADQSAEMIEAEVTEMLAAAGPGREEWAIHDYEGFGSFRLSEWEALATVAAVAAGIVEHGDAFTAWADYDRSVIDDAPDAKAIVDAFAAAYAGTFPSLEDWADEFLAETGQLDAIPETLRHYFDFAAWARDAEIGGDVWSTNMGGDVAVFWGNV